MDLLYDPEETITCPYDSAHRIRRCKMAFHIVKCKKNFAEQRKVRCDFNSTHMIPEPELQHHHERCPDRKTVEQKVVDCQETFEDKYPVVNQHVPTDESWDDLNCPAYDPLTITENREVLRHLDVESAAKRKQFRIAERQRIGALQENPIPKPSSSDTEAVKLPRHKDVKDLQIMQKIKEGSKKVFVQKEK